MKRHVVNARTYADGHGNPSCETITGVSNTIPGMTLSLRQLLERYTRGENVQIFQPVFTDDDDVPDNLERMNEMDRLDLARDVKLSADKFREDIVKARNERVAAAAAKAPPPPKAVPTPGAEPELPLE